MVRWGMQEWEEERPEEEVLYMNHSAKVVTTDAGEESGGSFIFSLFSQQRFLPSLIFFFWGEQFLSSH
jgi:hypothetical protein